MCQSVHDVEAILTGSVDELLNNIKKSTKETAQHLDNGLGQVIAHLIAITACTNQHAVQQGQIIKQNERIINLLSSIYNCLPKTHLTFTQDHVIRTPIPAVPEVQPAQQEPKEPEKCKGCSLGMCGCEAKDETVSANPEPVHEATLIQPTPDPARAYDSAEHEDPESGGKCSLRHFFSLCV